YTTLFRSYFRSNVARSSSSFNGCNSLCCCWNYYRCCKPDKFWNCNDFFYSEYRCRFIIPDIILYNDCINDSEDGVSIYPGIYYYSYYDSSCFSWIWRPCISSTYVCILFWNLCECDSPSCFGCFCGSRTFRWKSNVYWISGA